MLYYGQEFYLPGANIPEIFLIADKIMHERIKKEHPEWLIKRATPKKIPMPFIEGKPHNGPLYVTEDWYVKRKKKQLKKKAKKRKDERIDLLEMQIRIKQIKRKLSKLDPGKKKDFKKIYDLNLELKDLECEIKAVEAETGQKVDELEEGSKLQRAIQWLKHKFKQMKKKVCKWVDKHEDLVIGILSVGIPLLLYGVFQAVFHVPFPPPVPI